jgi:segregation and condensation protein B
MTDSNPAPTESPAPAVSIDDPELPDVPLATRIEALLFVASEPLPLKRLKELVRVDDGRVVREAIDGLAADYVATGRAIRIEEVAGGFQLRTRPELAALVARVGRKVESEKLSAAALETLAIVAYRQPVLRADIERIRGVASGEVLRALVERNLVRVAGRAELPGSPLYYGTTTRFLEVFGLRDLAELPQGGETLRQPS